MALVAAFDMGCWTAMEECCSMSSTAAPDAILSKKMEPEGHERHHFRLHGIRRAWALARLDNHGDAVGIIRQNSTELQPA
jgi:hypothetical protein